MVRVVRSIANKTSGRGSSENGGEDQVPQPVGTGPRFSIGVLKVTVRVPSVIESTEVPKGIPEISFFVVMARYTASGLIIGVLLVVLSSSSTVNVDWARISYA